MADKMAEALEGVAPQPRYIEHIQFEGRDCVVLSPEEYEALWECALSALPDAQSVADEALELLRKLRDYLWPTESEDWEPRAEALCDEIDAFLARAEGAKKVEGQAELAEREGNRARTSIT